MQFVNLLCDTFKAVRSAVIQALTVTANAAIGGTLTVTGATTLNGGLSVGAASNHSYGSAHADWTLSAAENKATLLTTTDDSADQGVNAIATPTAGKLFILKNTCGQTLTLKASGQTGIAVANDRITFLMGNGTDFIRITADQAF